MCGGERGVCVCGEGWGTYLVNCSNHVIPRSRRVVPVLGLLFHLSSSHALHLFPLPLVHPAQAQLASVSAEQRKHAFAIVPSIAPAPAIVPSIAPAPVPAIAPAPAPVRVHACALGALPPAGAKKFGPTVPRSFVSGISPTKKHEKVQQNRSKFYSGGSSVFFEPRYRKFLYGLKKIGPPCICAE
jgi:hypothetical protein